MDLITIVIIFVVALVLVWLVSWLVEALRPVPQTPEAMPWAPSLEPAYVAVHGVSLRYLRVGEGPVLVLLHTLRTQLDLFHKVIPELAKGFTVYRSISPAMVSPMSPMARMTRTSSSDMSTDSSKSLT